jgi:DNA invertase Pin-like site-specific DNA recombinase
MSEAELHLIRARMRGGVLNKAKRGELITPLPLGFTYDDASRVVLDPDQQIQQPSDPYSTRFAVSVQRLEWRRSFATRACSFRA